MSARQGDVKRRGKDEKGEQKRFHGLQYRRKRRSWPENVTRLQALETYGLGQRVLPTPFWYEVFMDLQKRPWLKFLAISVVAAAVLKFLYDVRFATTALTAAGLWFGAYLVTFDEELPGGWCNPFGEHKPPYGELAARGLIFFAALIAWLMLAD